ncbi:MAG: hypothetical protein LBR48_09400 [Dysgonamonadaceae bacterium]|jgi:hypothetical protein|nr:hypothetical protein [Dysgonamonadaceae bacterium]
MKKFLITFTLFSLGLLGLAFLEDAIITRDLKQSNISTLIGWNDIFSGKLEKDVVIMGSSRASVQYNPQILDSALNCRSYNLGIAGNPINWEILKYDTYRRYNSKPKAIIQNIDCFDMYYTEASYEKRQFLPYFSEKEFIANVSEYQQDFGILDKYVPFYRYIGSVYRLYYDRFTEKETLTNGYHWLDRKWDGRELEKQKKIDYGQDDKSLSLFDQYLSKARSEGIRVIFVYAPIYIELTKKIKNLEGMYEMYDSIATKHHIPILDYNFSPISQDTAYFFNAMHLNKKGSELFSKQLAHDLDSLGFLK